MKIVLLALALQAASVMASIPGGWAPKPVDDEQVKEMAAFAVPHLQDDINHTAFFKLHSVDSAEAQVVSGMNYRVQITLVETTCDAAAHKEGSEHETAASPAKVQCTVVVYDQPWTSTRKVTQKTCGEIQKP